MDLGANADGELLQRALDGERVADPGILELMAVLHAVSSVDQAGLAPRPEFVADLRARLLADGATAGTGAPAGEPPATGATVSVLRVASRPLKLIAAAAAAILVVGGSLGVASRSAAPGDALYGVKQLLNRAAVQMAGSRYDQGLTYLAQAQEHISEARDLIDRGNPSPHDLDTAYDAATDATIRAQTLLMEAYLTEQRTDALTELADFYARAIPQVDAMRPQVPAASTPAWQRLRDVLGSGEVETLRALATCSACGGRASGARHALTALTAVTGTVRPGSPVSGTTAPGTLPSQVGTSSAPRPSGTRPPASSTGAPGLPLPGGGLPVTGGVGVTGGVTVPGGTVNLPNIGVTSSSVGAGGGGITLPGVTATVPSVVVTPTTIGVGGGGVTLPSLTVSVPTAAITVPSVPVSPPLLP